METFNVWMLLQGQYVLLSCFLQDVGAYVFSLRLYTGEMYMWIVLWYARMHACTPLITLCVDDKSWLGTAYTHAHSAVRALLTKIWRRWKCCDRQGDWQIMMREICWQPDGYDTEMCGHYKRDAMWCWRDRPTAPCADEEDSVNVLARWLE